MIVAVEGGLIRLNQSITSLAVLIEQLVGSQGTPSPHARRTCSACGIVKCRPADARLLARLIWFYKRTNYVITDS